jgi:hypothetical protein
MRRLLASLLLAGVLAPALGAAADQPAEAPPKQTTQVAGAAPNLVGRWLVVSRIEIPTRTDLGSTIASLWDVTASGGTVSVNVPQVELPKALQDELAQANSTHAPWAPSPRELQDLRDGWSSLKPIDRGVGQIETKISGKDAFDAVAKGEQRMKDALFIVQQTVDFLPGEGRPIKDVYLYGALAQQPDGWSGNYMSASIAPTPVPIPIVLNGTFRIYRLDSVATPGLLQRFFDMFSGCGRKR